MLTAKRPSEARGQVITPEFRNLPMTYPELFRGRWRSAKSLIYWRARQNKTANTYLIEILL